jgi:hypothetical protein
MSETQKTKQQREVVRKRSPHHRTVYANQVGSTATAMDVRLRFGCIESATSERLVVEDQVDVFLGPLELLGLHQLLGRLIKKLDVQIQPTEAGVDALNPDDIKQTIVD